jgi:hypothetical protein
MINWLSASGDRICCNSPDGHKTIGGMYECHIEKIESDGPVASVSCFCESGHQFVLEFSNQKGFVGFRIVERRDWTDHPTGGSRPAKLNSTS